MSVLEQYHQAIEYESKRLKEHRIGFGRREDIRIEMREINDHGRICRQIIKSKRIDFGIAALEEIDHVVVDVCHWGVEE